MSRTFPVVPEAWTNLNGYHISDVLKQLLVAIDAWDLVKQAIGAKET